MKSTINPTLPVRPTQYWIESQASFKPSPTTHYLQSKVKLIYLELAYLEFFNFNRRTVLCHYAIAVDIL